MDHNRTICRPTAALILLTALFLSAHQTAFGQEKSGPTFEPAFEVRVENPDKGNYVVTASMQVDASPLVLAKAIADFPSQCKKGCAMEVPSIDRVEVVHGSFEQGRMTTWTVIDDVLDATYWTDVSIHQEPQRIQIKLSHPTHEDLERWQSEERPHQPFFHIQNGAWTLHYSESDGTRIDYRMEMSSDRFLVNLMPSQVLKGAKRHATQMLYFLSSLGRSATEPGR